MGKKKKCERIFDALKMVTGHGLFSTSVTGQVGTVEIRCLRHLMEDALN
jgi:hypothetical protein